MTVGFTSLATAMASAGRAQIVKNEVGLLAQSAAHRLPDHCLVIDQQDHNIVAGVERLCGARGLSLAIAHGPVGRSF